MSDLPIEEIETIVDVDLKHVFFVFGGIVVTSFVVSAGVIVLRDYAKYKRQKAVIESATKLLLIVRPHKEDL